VGIYSVGAGDGAHGWVYGDEIKGVPTRACLDLSYFLFWIGKVTKVTYHRGVGVFFVESLFLNLAVPLF